MAAVRTSEQNPQINVVLLAVLHRRVSGSGECGGARTCGPLAQVLVLATRATAMPKMPFLTLVLRISKAASQSMRTFSATLPSQCRRALPLQATLTYPAAVVRPPNGPRTRCRPTARTPPAPASTLPRYLWARHHWLSTAAFLTRISMNLPSPSFQAPICNQCSGRLGLNREGRPHPALCQ